MADLKDLTEQVTILGCVVSGVCSDYLCIQHYLKREYGDH